MQSCEVNQRAADSVINRRDQWQLGSSEPYLKKPLTLTSGQKEEDGLDLTKPEKTTTYQ